MAVKLRSVVVLCTLFTVLAAKQGVHGEGSHRHLARSGALRRPRADEFNYVEGDDKGPANWPGLCKDGTSQSPVDIVVSETERMDVTEALQVPDFVWSTADVNIVNDGHMVKLVPKAAVGQTTTTTTTLDPGGRASQRQVKRSGRKAKSESSLLRGGPLTGEYTLKEVQFHWGATDEEGSEHAIDSTFYTMEMQMVFNRIPDTKAERRAFRDAHDDTAILVVFFKAADDNPALVPVVSALQTLTAVDATGPPTDTVSTAELLPVHREPLLVYKGSLTTPPCSETVTWIIFEEPVTVSSTQVEEFRKVKAADAGTGDLLKTNRRPLVARDPEASRIGVAVAVQVWPSLALFCSFILIFIN